MESEKVKEIKESLQQEYPTVKFLDGCIAVIVSPDLLKDCLTLINELEREKKEHGKKKFLRGWKLGIEEIAERLKEKLKARHEVNRLLLMPVRDVVLSTIEGLFEDVDKTLKELINE